MSCSKTITGLCSHCGAWWGTITKSHDPERCAKCREVVIVPLHDFSPEQDSFDQALESMGLVKVYPPLKKVNPANVPPQEVFPPEGNWCSRCHRRFDDQGICPCG